MCSFLQLPFFCFPVVSCSNVFFGVVFVFFFIIIYFFFCIFIGLPHGERERERSLVGKGGFKDVGEMELKGIFLVL
jgi:hypothetical protein